MLLLSGCGSSDADKAKAADYALSMSLPGGSLSNCLNIAGYDVRPDYVKEGTIRAPA